MIVRRSADGYVALLAVLVVGAAAVVIALGLLLTGADSQRTGLIQQQSAQARQLASACAEEALQLVTATTSYTGNSTLSLGTGACTLAVTSTSTTTRVIDATGTVGPAVKKLKIYVTITTLSISITSWQEVADA